MDNINFTNILTIAQAEKRLTRRLKRYWVFVIASYFAGLALFTNYSVIHALFSSYSATLGTINPHYLLSVYGFIFQAIFTIGVVFTAFDIRARDVRERIVEVLDCRPISNLELIVGRFFALFQLAWIPVLVFCCLLQLLGWLLPLLGVPFGSTVEWDSLVNFAVFLTLPAFVFSISLVFLVTLLVKNRVLSAIISMGILGGMFAGITYLPIPTYPFWDNFGFTIASQLASDMTSVVTNTEGLLQRLGFLVLGLAFLGFSAAIHPRLDDSNRPRTALIAGAILAAGLVALVGSSVVLSRALSNPEWVAAHEAVEASAIPDIVSIDGVVTIEPGRSLQVAAQLEIEAPATSSLQSALFTLNPGFTVDSVTDANDQALTASHENGLLSIDLPATLAAGQRTVIKLSYSGKPDNQFAYIDSQLKLEKLEDFQARGLSGAEAGMFDEDFVALMPGTYWLPLAGNDIDRDDTRTVGRDFFSVDLEVQIPEGWLIAGPGMRQELASQQENTIGFRFAPQPQLTEVALVAAEYTRYTADIEGVHFEILVDPAHTRNFEVLAPLRPEIEAWVANRLALAEDAGLIYPFDAFTLVEVPNGLRVYEGGWRMDTAMAPPAMMLMNESGFPTSRFDFSVQSLATYNADGTANQQGIDFDLRDSAKAVPFDRLLNFFTSDLSGGNVFMGMSRSYFAHHTAATGEEAIALNFILDMLATLVVSDERYYFSMYNDINASVNGLINIIAGGAGGAGQSITQRTIGNFSNNVNVWNNSMGVSLATIDTERAPQATINLLTLKGGALAQAIYDVLGAQRSGEFLAKLLEQHRESSYRLTDVVALLATFDQDLSVLFEETFTSTELPGFVVQNADLYRLPDGINGEQRFQLLVALRNDEPVTGFTRVTWAVPNDDKQEFSNSAPIRIDGRSAIEFGVVLSTPPASALITPYLSLNRGQFLAKTFNVDEIRDAETEAFEGVRPVAWDNSSERIIVDDLDPSFYVIDDNGQSTPDRVAAEGEAPLDQGIRLNNGDTPDNWNRIASAGAYGLYRHTYVTILAGAGDKKAVLTADIPRAGLWDLEVHIPAASTSLRQDDMRGIWNMAITTNNGVETIAFDNRNAINGWNLIGSFELPRGEAKIEITNQTDAIVVRVDAFAWTPVNTNSTTNSEAAQ
jgi:ABC-type transport system involved in multi-copper enzyme maturation permease subunit